MRKVVSFLMAVALLPLATAASPPAIEKKTVPTSPTDRDARIADLIQVWYLTKMFHPGLAGDAAAWDAALVDTVPAALAAADDAAFARVVDTMLSRVGGAATVPGNISPVAKPATAAPPAFRLEQGTAVGSCLGIGQLTSARALNDAIGPVAAAMSARGLVIDCRGFAQDGASYLAGVNARQWLVGAVGSRLQRDLPTGGRRVRFHDGFPPEVGSTSGGYSDGTATLSYPPIRAAAAPADGKGKVPIVLVIDDGSPLDWDVTASLQRAGIARVVAVGDTSSAGRRSWVFPHVAASIPIADYVGADGVAGYRPDACVDSGRSAEALTLAAALLDPRRSGPACPPAPAGAGAAWVTTPGSPAELVPSVGERVLALAKMWGAIQYFYPYRALLDRPWDDQLAPAVPHFLAATDRAAYEEAVQQLAHAVPDTHTGIAGLRESLLGRSNWMAPLYVRPIGSAFVVLGVQDPALADRVRVGDEITAIDGVPAAELAARLDSLIPASTKQSLDGIVASILTAGPKDSVAQLSLRHAEGTTTTATIPRSVRARSVRRPTGTLPIWGRLTPTIGYIDLERLTAADADRALDDLLDTRAIVFDLRGYPQGTAWVVAPRLALPGRDGAVAATFRRQHYLGPGSPGESSTVFDQPLPPTDKAHYKGKVVVLIDARAVSQSEHTALFFRAAANPIFVGTPTTGADGDITSVRLPGGLALYFGGHDVRYPDGRQLQRIGIQPDLRVAPTLAGIRAGRDEVLAAGLRSAGARTGEAKLKPHQGAP